MKKLILLLALAVCFNGKAQTWDWAKGTTGTGTGEGYASAVDTAGNVFITGMFNGSTITFGTDTLTDAGPNYIPFIVKYNASGNVLWAKSAAGMGGTIGDRCYSISADSMGNAFITGYFQSHTIAFGTYTLTNASTTGYYNIFIAKYDANGNVLWAKSAGGTGGDGAYSINTDVSGNVFVTGFFSSPTITFGTYTLTNTGNNNIFIAKYDANGNVLWAKGIGGTGYDGGYSVSTDATGNAFVTGYFSSPIITIGTYTLTNGTGYDNIFIAKYDANGNVLWAKSAGGITNDIGNSIRTDAMGNVFVTGYFSSPTITFGTYTLTNVSTGTNAFIVKYNASGSILWARSAIDSVGSSIGYSLSTDAGGNVFVTGSFNGITTIFGNDTLIAPVVGFNDDPMFIVKYDANGNVLCASALASGGDDQNGVCVDHFGNAYIAGDYAVNPFVVGSDTLYLTGSENVFVAKWTPNCQQTIGIAETTNINEVTIYPNPTSSVLNVECEMANEKSALVVTDMLGNSVKQMPFATQHSTINLSDLSEGIYNLSISGKEGVVNKRVVIVR